MQEPELPEALPAPVVGQQGQEVVELGREGVAVVVRGEEPGRGALEHIEVRDLVDEERDELGRTRPRADHGDPPAGRGRRCGPRRPSGTAGPAKSWRPSTAGNDGRFSWPTAQTTASKVSVVDAVVAAARRGDLQAPLPRPVVEAGLGHLGGEADDVAQAGAPWPRPGGRRAGRAGPRSASPIHWSGRRRSCRAGWARRPGSPGTRSRARCRRRRGSSRTP